MIKPPLFNEGIRPNGMFPLNSISISSLFQQNHKYHSNDPAIPQCNTKSESTTQTPTKRKQFTTTEDYLLTQAALACFETSWNIIATYVPGRTPRQCRDRWMNYLKPGLKFDPWSKKEDEKLVSMVNTYGTHWAKMISFFPGRSTNALKNRWYWLLNNYIGIEKKNLLTDNHNKSSLEGNQTINAELNNQNINGPKFDMNFQNELKSKDGDKSKVIGDIELNTELPGNLQDEKYVLLNQKIKKNISNGKNKKPKNSKKAHNKNQNQLNDKLNEDSSFASKIHTTTQFEIDKKDPLIEQLFGSNFNLEEFEF